MEIAADDIIRFTLAFLIEAAASMDSTPQQSLPGSSPDEMFPALAREQQARLLTQGRIRKVTSGEILVELNQQPTKVFVVVDGKLEVVRVSDNREEVFAVCGSGMFTGES